MSESPIDPRRPDALALIRAQRLGVLLGDVPAPLPDWYSRTLAPSRGKPRPELDEWQQELVRAAEDIHARRAVPALPPVVQEVEAEWVEDEE